MIIINGSVSEENCSRGELTWIRKVDLEGHPGFHLQLYIQEFLLGLLSDFLYRTIVPGISFCGVSGCRGPTEVQLKSAHLNLIPQV